MNAETEKVKAKLAALSSSLDELESLLEPLFSQTLPETLVGLEPLQQAKLQTVLPYVIYDLIFIYLKSRGIDPKTHPVVPELDRIRGYFEKINNAENPPAKRSEIDKEAASRFIKHAIAQAQWKATPAEQEEPEVQETRPSSTSTSAQQQQPSVPPKVTQKMLDRAAYEKELKAQDAMQDEEEDDALEVYDEDEDAAQMDVDANPRNTSSSAKGKAKETAHSSIAESKASKKRRRPAVDPFAGYGENSNKTDNPSTPSSNGVKKTKSSKPLPSEPAAASTRTTTPSSQQSTPAPPNLSNQETPKSSSTSKKSKKKKSKKPTT